MSSRFLEFPEVLRRTNFDNSQHPTVIHFQSVVPDVQRHWFGPQIIRRVQCNERWSRFFMVFLCFFLFIWSVHSINRYKCCNATILYNTFCAACFFHPQRPPAWYKAASVKWWAGEGLEGQRLRTFVSWSGEHLFGIPIEDESKIRSFRREIGWTRVVSCCLMVLEFFVHGRNTLFPYRKQATGGFDHLAWQKKDAPCAKQPSATHGFRTMLMFVMKKHV